jgi:uncharacterized flavoprotein (TIGR03862 family)
MAAETLATAGFRVDLYEHMASVGRKFLLAGRSGLNLTHGEPLQDLLTRYGDVDLVRNAVQAFPPDALREWARGLGQPTYVGSSGRVFPTSSRATPLLRAWLARLRDLDVTLHVRHQWLDWSNDDPRAQRFRTADGSMVQTRADVSVFALGGASWPRVGSDGGWVAPFLRAGLDVRPLRPANCGLHVAWTPQFGQYAGVPLKNVRLTVGDSSARGDAMVTDVGLESGPVYLVSSAARDAIERDGECTLTVDLHPDLSSESIEDRLASRRTKDSASNALRRSLNLSPVAIALLREATGNELPNTPGQLAGLIKALPLRVYATSPLARAISTAGGLARAEMDEHFMVRKMPGTFVAGEMLDWDAPTGGYLLQASFSTAVAAARGAIAWVNERQ